MVSKLLQQIADLQTKEPNPFFPIGVFPSFRESKWVGYVRPDDNIFATASVVFILNELKPLLSTDEQLLTTEIAHLAQKAYSSYRNKDGLPTYNFWRTMPSNHFSNGLLLRRLKHFKLPDDIDDTALIHLTQPHTPQEKEQVKAKLGQHSQPLTYVYSTWFGEKMPTEHDVCALCNLMYWIMSNPFELNQHDVSTLLFLREVLSEGKFRQNPFRYARHYASVPLILYHFARLMSRYAISQLGDCKEPLISYCRQELRKDVSEMDAILLSTSLLKMGEYDIPESQKQYPSKSFYSFIGAFLGPYSIKYQWLEPTAAMSLFRFSWKCEAHELALKLENELLKKLYAKSRSQ